MKNASSEFASKTAAVSANRMEKGAGLTLLTMTFVYYVMLMPGFSVPGRWAGIAAVFSGEDPFRPVMRPIWSGLCALLAALPLADIGWVYNVVTVIAGAVSCWLVYEIVRRIPFARSRWRGPVAERERMPRLLAGFLAGLFLAVSLPMVVFSTRGDYAVTDVLLLLLAFYPAARYQERPGLGLLYASCALMGLALIEYPTAAMVLPGFLVWWGLMLWREKLPKTSPYFLAASLLFSGVVALAVYALIYDGSQAAALREVKGSSQVLFEFVRLYFLELTRSVPKVGWLLIIGLNLVPFAAVMFRELDEPVDKFTAIGVYAFRLVLIALAVLSLFSLPGSPAHVMGSRSMLLAPSVIVGIWSGYLIAYLYGLLTDTARDRRRGRGRRKQLWGPVLVFSWLVILLGAGVRHGVAARVDHLAPAARFAEQVVQHLEGRDFLLTDGSLDPSIKLAARQAGVHLNLINLQIGPAPEYGRYYASMFDDPALKSLAVLGVPALMRDWMGRDGGALNRAALLASPELLRLADISFKPGALFYTPHKRGQPWDEAGHYNRAAALWPEIHLPDLTGMKPGDDGWFQALFVSRWMSRLANDFGFLLDEKDQSILAGEAYRRALAVWPDNMSATLNLREQALRDDTGEQDVLEEQLKAQVDRNPAALNTRYLHYVCGWLSNPGAMLEQLGAQGVGPIDLQQLSALASSVKDEDERLRMNLAQLYLRGASAVESAAIYESLLATNPQNLDAHYGLLQVAMAQGDYEEAQSRIELMDALGADAKRLRLDRAAVLLASGKYEEARVRYLDLVRDPGAPAEAWFALAQLGIRLKDEDLLNTAFASLERERSYVPGLMLLGERALHRRQPVEARSYFARVVTLDPANQGAMARLLQIAYGLRDSESIRTYAGKLLALSPNDPFANYMSAFVHIDAERYDLAEAALLRSIGAREDGAALNELAWVLTRQDKVAEALPRALRAVELAPNNHNAWDTLAEIHYKLGQNDEALAAIDRALELNKNHEPNLYLHAAELHMAADQQQRAREILRQLDAVASDLSEADKTRRTALVRLLETSR